MGPSRRAPRDRGGFRNAPGKGAGAASTPGYRTVIALLKGGFLHPDAWESLGGDMLEQLRGLINRTRALVRGRRALVLLAVMTGLALAGPTGITGPMAATASNHH